MVKAHQESGYRFYYYAGEANESPHIHIKGSTGRMKVWLLSISLADCQGLPPQEQQQLLELVTKQQESLLQRWNESKGVTNLTENKATPLTNLIQYPTLITLQVDPNVLAATLSDGRSVVVPLAWFPRLRKASFEQLKKFEIAWDGQDVTWPELDEDVSVKSFIDGLANSCC